jgi:hypothetical protein
MKTRT